jgi:hypothetical protein
MRMRHPIDAGVRDNYVKALGGDRLGSSCPGATSRRVACEFAVSDLFKGQVMERSNYELVRYPSGQLVITRKDAKNAGFRDIVGVFASEAEALRMLDRLNSGELVAQPALALAG